jgi:hypothetical protein
MAATKTLTFTGAAGADAVGVEVEAQAVNSSAAAGTASQRAVKREDLEEVILEPVKKDKDGRTRTTSAPGVLQPPIVGAGKSAM